jgi:hypothetical protein
MMLVPNIRKSLPLDTYWQHTPSLISNFLEILGFTKTTVNYHHQIYNDQNGEKIKFFTVVGRKTFQSAPNKEEGKTTEDSSNNFDLKHILGVAPIDYRTKVNEPINIEVAVSNVGKAKWLHENFKETGVIKLGMHLYDRNKELVDLDFFRSPFEKDILPGEKIMKKVSVLLPNSGEYYLGLDLVCEHICWFENVGSEPKFIKVIVE